MNTANLVNACFFFLFISLVVNACNIMVADYKLQLYENTSIERAHTRNYMTDKSTRHRTGFLLSERSGSRRRLGLYFC